MKPALTGQALDDAIASRPYPHVTMALIESRVKKVEYMLLGATGTLCLLTLENGFTTQGFSACVNPANFDMQIGQGLAYKDAIHKVWPLEGYLLAEANFQTGKYANSNGVATTSPGVD